MVRILTLTSLLLLTIFGCEMRPEINLGPRIETRIVPERLGTPMLVVEKDEIEVVAPDATEKPIVGKVHAEGMMLLDRPTYELYHEAWKRQAKAAREMVDVDVTPGR